MRFTRRMICTLFLFTTLTLFTGATFAQNPEGDPIGPGNEIHDQRTGSVLIYNYYTSLVPGTQNTLISITNTNATTGIMVQLGFVSGDNGHALVSYLPLAPNQTQTFRMGDVDPEITGYIIAYASSQDGTPLQFDYLMGLATITLAAGQQATLGALAVPTNPHGSLAALPRQLALDQVPSPQDNVDRMLIINRIDGDLTGGNSRMPAIGALQGEMFNDRGTRFLFHTSANQGSQATIFTRDFLAFNLRFLPSGRYGWLRLRPTGEGAITGAVLFFTRNPQNGTRTPAPGSYNLRHLTNTQATLYTPGGPLLFGY